MLIFLKEYSMPNKLITSSSALSSALQSLTTEQAKSVLESLKPNLNAIIANPEQTPIALTTASENNLITSATALGNAMQYLTNQQQQSILAASTTTPANNMQAHGLFAQPALNPEKAIQSSLSSNASMRSTG